MPTMFSPVGSHPPSVYWRRRLIVIGSIVLLVLLLVLTAKVLAGGSGDDNANAAGSTSASSSTSTSRPPATPSTTPTSSARDSSTRGTTTKRSSQQTSGTAPVVPVACRAGSLDVRAVVGQDQYKVGSQPMVAMQVTNTGSAPCVQDLADKQVVLRVYNGESRVWGSHDCEIQPGTTKRTLPMNQPVKVSITWSGRTSQEGCQGTRQRVGAGTYTLYAQLAGKSGKAARFTIS